MSELLFLDAENIRAEIEHIATNEMVFTLEDFLRRRTRIVMLFSKKIFKIQNPFVIFYHCFLKKNQTKYGVNTFNHADP